jgi:hypothetical protein
MVSCPTLSSIDWWNDWRLGERGLNCECGSTDGEQLPGGSSVAHAAPSRGWAAAGSAVREIVTQNLCVVECERSR